MSLDEAAHDRQTETEAAGRAVHPLGDLHELIEHAIDVRLGDPDALVEHVLMMVVAVVLVHVGVSRVRKGKSDSAKFQTATIWWGIATAAIAGFIPWQRPLFPF